MTTAAGTDALPEELARQTDDVGQHLSVFAGTRVPVYNLFDYLEAGDSLGEFLAQFPSVTRDQVIGALELAREAVAGVAGSR